MIIATRATNIGMGGPAMIEGGGLGVFKPEEIGPASVQSANGVIDVLVDDEAQAVAAARHYLSFFQGTLTAVGRGRSDRRCAMPSRKTACASTTCARVLRLLADAGSLLELRAGFGAGMITALARIEGRPVGLIANNPQHLGGAIDAEAADKAARFMQLCNAHGLPLCRLVDTPGFMVGPEVERQAQVRHAARMFVTAAALRVPYFSVVLRKGYGLGAMAHDRGRLPCARSSPSPGRPASSARWGSKARCGWATARSSRRRPPGPSARRCIAISWRASTRRAARSTWRPRWRSTR